MACVEPCIQSEAFGRSRGAVGRPSHNQTCGRQRSAVGSPPCNRRRDRPTTRVRRPSEAVDYDDDDGFDGFGEPSYPGTYRASKLIFASFQVSTK